MYLKGNNVYKKKSRDVSEKKVTMYQKERNRVSKKKAIVYQKRK